MLVEAKSEILKQECKVDSLNACIRELQRQAHSHWLELDGANGGYEESRREQARQHEELALREKALRYTRIRNIHEVEELKRVQEMRTDEFSRNESRESHATLHSRNESRESHATLQEVTSQIQELQDRMNYISDSREFQDVESICSGNYLTFPVSRQSFQACDLIHEICLGKRFGQSTCNVRFITDTLSRNSPRNESKSHRWNPSAKEYRETRRERRRTNSKHNPHSDFCKKAINHDFFLTSDGCSTKTAYIGGSF